MCHPSINRVTIYVAEYINRQWIPMNSRERQVIIATMADIKPPFTAETARQKVKAAQDLWNTQ